MNGKAGNLGNEMTLNLDKNIVAVTSDIPLSKRWVSGWGGEWVGGWVNEWLSEWDGEWISERVGG